MRVLLFLSVFLFALAQAQVYDLTLLVTRDISGNILPIDAASIPCTLDATVQNSPLCFGGAPREMSYIKQIRSSNTNVLVLDTGKYAFGSLFYLLFNYTLSADVFRFIGYNTSSISTRDFSVSNAFLAGMLTRMNIQPVASNLNVTNDANLNGKVLPWQVITVSNRKIGIVAILDVKELSEASSAGRNVTVNLANFSSKQLLIKAISDMRFQHSDCNIVVLTLHSSSTAILDLAISYAQDIEHLDLILYTGRRSSSAFPETVVTSVFGNNVLLYSPVGVGSINNIKMSFNAQGFVTSYSGAAVRMNSSVTPDANMLNFITPFAYQVQNFSVNQISVATAPIAFSTNLCRGRDCPMARLWSDAMLNACPTCDFAIFNAGMLSATIAAGPITLADLIRVNPFNNYMVIITLAGNVLLDALQNGVQLSRGDGRFLQGAGIRYAYNNDETKPISSRVLEILIRDKSVSSTLDPKSMTWKRWSPSVNYTVAINDFMRIGGDGYSMMQTATGVDDFGITIRDAVSIYLNLRSTYTPVSVEDPDFLSCSSRDLALPIAPYTFCRVVLSNDTFDIRSICQPNIGQCLAYEDPISSFILDIPSQLNRSECNSPCAGLGDCNGISCICTIPKSGLFKGHDMLRGPSCTDVRNESSLSEAWQNAIYVVTSVSALLCVVASLVYLKFRQHAVILSSSPLFLHLVNFGGLCLCGAVILLVQPPSESTCMSFAWLFVLGFILTFGSLFVKTYRISVIFNNKQLKINIKLSNEKLLLMLAGMFLIQGIVLIVMNAYEPLDKYVILSSNWTFSYTCGSENAIVFLSILAALNVIIIFMAAYVAYRVRNVMDNFNESRFLFAAIEGITVIVVVTFGLLIISHGVLVQTRVIFVAFIANFIVLFTHGVLLASKLFALKEYMKKEKKGDGYRPHNSKTPGSVPTHVYDTVLKRNEDLNHRCMIYKKQMDFLSHQLKPHLDQTEYDNIHHELARIEQITARARSSTGISEDGTSVIVNYQKPAPTPNAESDRYQNLTNNTDTYEASRVRSNSSIAEADESRLHARLEGGDSGSNIAMAATSSQPQLTRNASDESLVQSFHHRNST